MKIHSKNDKKMDYREFSSPVRNSLSVQLQKSNCPYSKFSEGKSIISRIFIISFISLIVLMFLFALFFSGKNQSENSASGALYSIFDPVLFIFLGIIFLVVIVLMILISIKKKAKLPRKK